MSVQLKQVATAYRKKRQIKKCTCHKTQEKKNELEQKPPQIQNYLNDSLKSNEIQHDGPITKNKNTVLHVNDTSGGDAL